MDGRGWEGLFGWYGNFFYRLNGELSGGERQLVLLARALFQDAPVLLLDEPTSHLDFKNQYMIMDSVLRFTRTKRLTTIITLHDPNLASRYCSHMVMLKEGHLVQDGATESVFTPDVLNDVYGIDVTVEKTSTGAHIVLPSRPDRPPILSASPGEEHERS